MKRRLASLFLQDILQAMDRIARFVGDRDYETFAADELLTSAVVRQLEIIGEAAKNLPQGIRERYADLPWHLMARMRDRLSHGYWTVDYEIVWRVIQEELPALRPRIEVVLEEVKAEEDGWEGP